MHLGVGPAGALMPAAAEDATLLDDDAADRGIGGAGEATALGELERKRQKEPVGLGHGLPPSCLPLSFSTSSVNSLTSWKSRYTEAKRT